MRNCYFEHPFLSMQRTLTTLFLLLLPLLAPLAATADSLALSIMERLYLCGEHSSMELIDAELYLKQRVEARRKNLLVNYFPNMTRFDKDENSYLSEYLYKVRYIHSRLPEIRRLDELSTFGKSTGEMDCVLEFMTPQLSGERLFDEEYLSPMSRSNSDYYDFSVDDAYDVPGRVRVLALPRYDNIQLLEAASFVVGKSDTLLYEVFMQGRNEQFHFSVSYAMAGGALKGLVVDSVSLSIDYSFARNNIGIVADGVFRYSRLLPYEDKNHRRRNYDVGSSSFASADAELASVDSLRPIPLSYADSLFYLSKGIMPHGNNASGSRRGSGDNMNNLLWRVGDAAISSHTLAWGGSDLKISPLINPSYLSYSSSKGLSYKLAVNMRSRFSSGRSIEVKPMFGYNFKYREPYWNVYGAFFFAPLRRAALTLDIGRGTSVYSSRVLDYIKESSLDSLRFDRLPMVYYRDFHVKTDVRFELLNGLELQLGANFYRRSLYRSVLDAGEDDVPLDRYYRRFAPHLRVTWQPGMYYYIAGGKKVNLGSLAPRFSLDVEQGVSGIFACKGRYTRVELEAQHRRRVSSAASLYLRVAGGGYFLADNIYFVDYAFLRNSLLPLDREDEISGVFQLLEREWYGSADKYFCMNASYESPFLFLQRALPSLRFIKNESLYANMLFISHLMPYWECGYGVETPYVNIGLFVGFERASFHKIGYKVSFSLFNE